MVKVELKIFVVFVIALCYVSCSASKIVQRSEVSAIREEVLNEKYVVQWEPNFDNQTIRFKVTVETTGFVGFGLSPNGGMAGADIVIGGVQSTGQSYFADYHGLAPTDPSLDPSQDWNLTSFSENGTHTILEFSRPFDTCDEHDNPITEDTTHFIWSYGPTDRIGYHGPNRGSSQVNILDPSMPEVDLTSFEKWSLITNMTMPSYDTSYWCTIHKRPDISDGKHHVVGFDAFLPTPEALKYSHHIVVSICIPPEGQNPDDVFGPYLGHQGQECNDPPQIPLDHCRSSLLYVWAVGGKITLFPENVGYPINEFGTNEYVMLEVHYDNPDKLSNVTFETGIIIYHTPELREEDAELLLVAHDLFPTHIIPPHSTNYTTVGHCSPSCTSERIPESGIKVFNVLLHSHLAGRKLKLRHFRNGTELPWLAVDQNYNFDFQQNRPLRNELVLLPGDQISYECVTDTMDRNYTTLAGLSTRHEMCDAFLWYYPRQNLAKCVSLYYDVGKIFDQFGIQNVTYEFDYFDPTVITPAVHAGKTVSQVMNEYPWTPDNKKELEAELRYSNHYGYCVGRNDATIPEPLMKKISQYKFGSKSKNNIREEWEDFLITYPNLENDYVPPNVCNATRY